MCNVSVIIPCYNGATYLAYAIESVLTQTYQDYELIIVDDGSTDKSAEIARSFIDNRVKYIYQENRGKSASRNTGIQKSNGKYLAFLDADDEFLPTKLENQVSVLEKNKDLDLVSGGWEYLVNQGPKRIEYPWKSVPIMDIDNWLISCPVLPCSVLVRRSAVVLMGGFDESLTAAQDWDFWLRLAVAGFKMEYDYEIVCRYRLHGHNSVYNASARTSFEIKVLDKFYSINGLSEKFLMKRDKVYASIYLTSAGRQFSVGQIKEAKKNLTTAIHLNPELLGNQGQEIFTLLIAWATYPTVIDPKLCVKMIFSNLPEPAVRLTKRCREAVAMVFMQQFYQYYNERNWSKVFRLYPAACLQDPKWLGNRGATLTWLESILGSNYRNLLRKFAHRMRIERKKILKMDERG